MPYRLGHVEICTSQVLALTSEAHTGTDRVNAEMQPEDFLHGGQDQSFRETAEFVAQATDLLTQFFNQTVGFSEPMVDFFMSVLGTAVGFLVDRSV